MLSISGNGCKEKIAGLETAAIRAVMVTLGPFMRDAEHCNAMHSLSCC